MQPSNTLEYEPAPPARSRDYLRASLVFGFGAVLGALLWALSPSITGEAEAWDPPGFYYFGGLFIAGFLAAWVEAYVRSQKEHHKRFDFKTEFLELLRRHGIEFDANEVFK